MALVKEFEHLKISLDVIKLATNGFSTKNWIGVGGFGNVYKGEIPNVKGLTKSIAIKRLDKRHGQAKISDFGLSKIGPANQEFTFLVSNVVGTLGYCDPLYAETGILTKESDVYSFGVVLCEILCGQLCIGKHDDEHRVLTRLVQQSYEKGALDEIIFYNLRKQMDRNSLKTFSSIAYKCVQVREERPTMVHVLAELERAYKYQESYQSGKPILDLKIHGTALGIPYQFHSKKFNSDEEKKA
ncbi:protein kinase, ATP binding site-containing protein [Tanacetum coccineum]